MQTDDAPDSHRTRTRRASRHRDPRVLAVGLLLLTALAAAFLPLGSVAAGPRAFFHLLLAGCCAAALTLPAARLKHAGEALRIPLAAACMGLAVAVGLLPLPAGLLQWVAPGVPEAFPGWRAHTLAVRPERVVSELCFWIALGGWGLCVGVWGATRWRRSAAELAAVGVLVTLVATGLGHTAVSAEAAFGWFTPRGTPEHFFPPLVNPNHAGSALVLLLPVAGAAALEARHGFPVRCAAAVGVLGAVVAIAVLGSPGVGVAAFVALLVWAIAALPHRLTRVVGGAGAALVALVVVAVAAARPLAAGVSRLTLWGDALRAALDHPLAGLGGGGWGLGVLPYRTDGAFVTVAHAHSEPVEWLSETGVVGLVAAVVALWICRPRVARGGRLRAAAWTAALVAFAFHALFEFAWQIPAVAALAVAVLAIRLTTYAPRRAVGVIRVRAALSLALGLQLAAALWMGVEASAEADAERALGPAREAAAPAARLAWTAPWRSERVVALARASSGAQALEHARALAARWPHDAVALERAALLLREGGALDEAVVVLERAVLRSPTDKRAWLMLASVAKQQGDWGRSVESWAAAYCLHTHESRQPVLAAAYQSLPVGLVWLDAFRDCPANRSAYLGHMLNGQGDYETALLAYEQAALIDPERYAWHPHRTDVLLHLGRIDEAEAFAAASWADQGTPAAARAYGKVLGRLGRHAEQAALYEQVAQERPEFRGLALRAFGLAEGPEAALERARLWRLQGISSAGVRLEVARLHHASGQHQVCLDGLDHATLRRSASLAKEVERLRTACRRGLDGG